MTIGEIQALDREFLTPSEVAPLIGCKPYSINVQAAEDISKLGFPAAKIGTRVRIPREGFLHWLKYGNAPMSAARHKEGEAI